MSDRREIEIPRTVRIKSGALDRIGIYLHRVHAEEVAVLHSEGLPSELLDRLQRSLAEHSICMSRLIAVPDCAVETADDIVASLLQPSNASCWLLGLGGGKALDVAKYVASRVQRPVIVAPTSLSNDGFASPQSSMTVAGRRRSLPGNMPNGVVVDTDVCLAAPKILWLSGVGDLVSKLTAVRDWKLAFHAVGEYVDDFAALLSDASVFQFMGRPVRDAEGVRLLATALMLNGIAMSVCGSSRPASGSEHLISHALDATSARPRLHGLQVGVATYVISQLMQAGTNEIRQLFDVTGFWAAIADDPFSRSEWETAIRMAPGMKPNFYTTLSQTDQTAALLRIIDTDPALAACFTD